MSGNTALRAALAFALMLSAAGTVFPQQTISTTIYFDYTSYLSKDGPVTSAAKNNYFAFRRAYFTYDNKINDNLKFRFRLDADNTANVIGVALGGTPPTASTSKDDKLRPFVKNLYFEWSDFVLPNQTLRVGMEETLTFKLAEDRWNYRSVAKTITDGYKDITGVDIDATSADIGVSLQGSAAKQLRYGVQIVNGSGYTHLENDKYKKFEGNIQVIPLAGFSLVGYLDYERQEYRANPLGLTSPEAVTCKVDSFFEMVKGLVVGAEWFVYRNDLYQTLNPATREQERFSVSGWSVFGRYALVRDKLNAFARYDSYAPNSLNRAKDMTLAILGLDWAPLHASLKLQPSVWIVSYEDGRQYRSSATSNTDVIFNLTFFMSF